MTNQSLSWLNWTMWLVVRKIIPWTCVVILCIASHFILSGHLVIHDGCGQTANEGMILKWPEQDWPQKKYSRASLCPAPGVLQSWKWPSWWRTAASMKGSTPGPLLYPSKWWKEQIGSFPEGKISPKHILLCVYFLPPLGPLDSWACLDGPMASSRATPNKPSGQAQHLKLLLWTMGNHQTFFLMQVCKRQLDFTCPFENMWDVDPN